VDGVSRGYTLMEVLVTLAIIGLVLAAIPLMAGDRRPGAEARAAAIEVASALRQTRSTAIAKFRSEVFVLDTEGHSYQVGVAGPKKALPEELSLSLYTARSELQDESAGRIRFFPDGSATGGRVTLASDDRGYVIAVDWLTGSVSLEE
jgi:general secretion pathway protein H